MRKILTLLLEGLDKSQKQSESTILSSLNALTFENGPAPDVWDFERLAFSFSEKSGRAIEDSGPAFLPTHTLKTKEGLLVEIPSTSDITESAIAHWESRIDSATHPVMRARYAGLVWAFKKQVSGKPPEISIAEKYIESILDLSRRDLYEHDIGISFKLRAALSLAICIANQTLVERIKEEIIYLEERISEDTKPGLWGFSFDALYRRKGVNLKAEDESKIVTELESKLARLQGIDPWATEHAAERLATYYKSKGSSRDVERVISLLGDSFELHSRDADAMLASGWLEHMHEIYIQFGLLSRAEAAAREIRRLGPQVVSEMQTASHTLEIPKEELDAYVNAFISGSLDRFIALLASKFLPEKNKIETLVHEFALQAPLTAFLDKQITDNDGRVVAVVGSVEKDLAGNVVRQMAQNISFESIFLAKVLERGLIHYSPSCEILVKQLALSPAYHESKLSIIAIGLKAYLKKDYLSSIHILLPQVEDAVSQLIELNGCSILKRGRGGGFMLRTLDEILRSEDFVTIAGENIALYLRVVLTDQRGWNIRNDALHGISSIEKLGKTTADRLIHCMFLISMFRPSAQTSN